MEEVITLASICGGAALEYFDREFQRVLDNIADVNTPAVARREIKIIVLVEPDEDRTKVHFEVKCDGKLAGIKPAQQTAFIGKKDGRIVAVGYNPSTPSLFDEPGASTVTPLRQVGFTGQGGVS